MRKHFNILALVMILCLAFMLPANAIKIAPYSQPLHDIMHWDVTSAKLIIMNPENESMTVSWPSTVDLWNYNGNSWTYDLPSGDKFAFSKRVDVNIATTEGAGSTIRGISLTDTVGAAGGIHEGLRSHVTTAYATGSWINAVVGVLSFTGGTGSASGGMAAPICSELNMQAAASSGGSYYSVHSYISVPTAAELIDSTAFNYAFEKYEVSDNASSDFNLYGLLWHLVGLEDVTTKVWYDNTLKIQIDTTKWYIPLSSAEGSYTSAYPVNLTSTGGYTAPPFRVQRTFVTADFDQTYHAAARVTLDLTNDVVAAKYASAFNVRIIGAGDVAATGQLYGLWVDSAGTAGAIGGTFHMARFSVQAGAAIPTSYLQFQTADPGVTYAFAFDNNYGVGPCTAGGTGSSYTIAVLTPDGDPGYIRVFDAR